MLYRIIYLSSGLKDLTSTDVKEILVKAKENNRAKNITGILLYLDKNFIQVLEGEKEEVIKLYEKISLDHRHKNVIKVIEGDIASRQFDKWDMGFIEIDSDDLKDLSEYKDFNFKNIFSKTDFIAETFLTTFLKSHRGSLK
jgi:hypothetical protein